MGYHLTILRSTSDGVIPIALGEAKLAASGLGWRFHDDPPGFTRVAHAGSCTVWHQDGELWTSSPDEAHLPHLVLLAEVLGARLRGDEFETYDSSAATYSHPHDLRLKQEAIAASEALLAPLQREQRLIRNGIVLFFVLLGAAGYYLAR
ncbi:hypothetical protein [Massilia sp. ST3]|uniref:hypothetical protein n=1 Tax=Massilia sp. ST3 TaxID=2824903 RepID=UPI001B82B49B|nr:hypothetical protein [Massilia sp. ST3]MBQ5947551.1 hypothetical protein [Massilia sp. ST3]